MTTTGAACFHFSFRGLILVCPPSSMSWSSPPVLFIALSPPLAAAFLCLSSLSRCGSRESFNCFSYLEPALLSCPLCLPFNSPCLLSPSGASSRFLACARAGLHCPVYAPVYSLLSFSAPLASALSRDLLSFPPTVYVGAFPRCLPGILFAASNVPTFVYLPSPRSPASASSRLCPRVAPPLYSPAQYSRIFFAQVSLRPAYFSFPSFSISLPLAFLIRLQPFVLSLSVFTHFRLPPFLFPCFFSCLFSFFRSPPPPSLTCLARFLRSKNFIPPPPSYTPPSPGVAPSSSPCPVLPSLPPRLLAMTAAASPSFSPELSARAPACLSSAGRCPRSLPFLCVGSTNPHVAWSGFLASPAPCHFPSLRLAPAISRSYVLASRGFAGPRRVRTPFRRFARRFVCRSARPLPSPSGSSPRLSCRCACLNL